jgi:hypothetical protein
VVKSFRERPLTGTFKYFWLDALMMKCREGGRIENVACLVGVGVNDDGRREILGLDVATAEDGAVWLALLRGLRARGLKGGRTGRLRCTSGAQGRDLLGSARRRLAALPDALHPEPADSRTQGRARHLGDLHPNDLRPARCRVGPGPAPADGRAVAVRFQKAADMLADAAAELLGFTAFPEEHAWCR